MPTYDREPGCCGCGDGTPGTVEVPCCPGVLLSTVLHATVAFSGCGACDRVVTITFDGVSTWEGFYSSPVFEPADGTTYALVVRLVCIAGTWKIQLTQTATGGTPAHRIGQYDACAASINGLLVTEGNVEAVPTGVCSPIFLSAGFTSWPQGTCPSTAYTVTVTA